MASKLFGIPHALLSLIPQKRFIGKFESPAVSTAAMQTVTLQVTAAWNYLDMYLRMANLTAAMIQQVRLKIGGDVIQKWGGADLDLRLQYDKQPAFATYTILKLPLRRMGIRGGMSLSGGQDGGVIVAGSARDLAYESSLNCGSGGNGYGPIKDVTIEIDVVNTGASVPTINLYARCTPPQEGGPGPVYRVDQQSKTIANGTVTITKSEMGLDALRPFLNRIVLVNPVQTGPVFAAFDQFQLRYGTNDWWTVPLDVLNQTQLEDNLRALQAGITVIDFQEEGFGDETLDLSASNSDILLQFQASGITNNPLLRYYIESVGLPFSANVSA